MESQHQRERGPTYVVAGQTPSGGGYEIRTREGLPPTRFPSTLPRSCDRPSLTREDAQVKCPAEWGGVLSIRPPATVTPPPVLPARPYGRCWQVSRSGRPATEFTEERPLPVLLPALRSLGVTPGSASLARL